MSNVSWLLIPASSEIAMATGTITGCHRKIGVTRRHITTAARYHIGQRGLRNHSSPGGARSSRTRQWYISHENTTYGMTMVVSRANRCRRL